MLRRPVCLAVLLCTFLCTTIALAQTTLETVKSRGKLVCGVNTGLAGFATVGPDGKWHGFDVDYCRAGYPLKAGHHYTTMVSGL
jgi:general L-amino acid transport system substrate-binding protein